MIRSLRSTALVAALVTLLLASGCSGAVREGSGAQAPSGQGGGLLEAYELGGLNAREIIDRLEVTPLDERPEGLMASVRPEALVLSGDEGEEELPLPDDVFYLSVAPYVDATHDCFFHSLTTCVGELGGQPVSVEVVDDAGEVVLSAGEVLNDNGFIGLWLPRGLEGTLVVEAEGRTASVPIATGSEDPTCLTTVQLV